MGPPLVLHFLHWVLHSPEVMLYLCNMRVYGGVVSDKYFVVLVDPDDTRRSDELPWEEVSKQTYVRHERNAGFWNTMGRQDEPATAGFSSSRYPYRGKIEYGPTPVRTEAQVVSGELDLF